MHEIIKDYINTESDIPTILEKYSDSKDKLVQHLKRIYECITGGGKTSSFVLSLIKNIEIRNIPPEMRVFLLTSLAHAILSFPPHQVKEHLPKAQGLIRKAVDLISQDLPVELVAYVRTVEALIAGYTGNHILREELLRKAFSSLPSDSPRRREIAKMLAFMLAEQGRLSEMPEILPVVSRTSQGAADANYFEFINAVETGQTGLAMSKLIDISSLYNHPAFRENIQKYRIFLELMNYSELSIKNYANLPDWGLVIYCLLIGNPHQALRWARLAEKSSSTSITGCGLLSYNLLRAELAEGNTQAARRLIEMRKECGNSHYMDDFFIARLELMEKNITKASAHFISVLETIRTHNAHGRLRFELKLALEMPREAMLDLLRTVDIQQGKVILSTDIVSSGLSTSQFSSSTPQHSPINKIIGVSNFIQWLKRTIVQIADMEIPVLLTGETGTGKELIARTIHEMSERKSSPFVTVDCGTISESLLESELFGHEKGAFTGAITSRHGLFEEAGNGTIFLDEIGEISSRVQLALLRVLETGEFRRVGSTEPRKISCRIITATNADLERLVKEGKYRKDLFYRLRRFEIKIPPLRMRKDDILPLAAYFLNYGRSPDVFATMSPALESKLLHYSWPGNARELRNVIEKMRLMNSDKLYYEASDVDLSLPISTQTVELQSAMVNQPQSDNVQMEIKDEFMKDNFIADNGPPWAGSSKIRRLAKMRQLFVKYRILTRIEVARALNISKNTATHDLKVLCQEGFIKKVQPSASPRSTYFVLKEK
jgi:DNA-binding NtrC family response regulator